MDVRIVNETILLPGNPPMPSSIKGTQVVVNVPGYTAKSHPKISCPAGVNVKLTTSSWVAGNMDSSNRVKTIPVPSCSKSYTSEPARAVGEKASNPAVR